VYYFGLYLIVQNYLLNNESILTYGTVLEYLITNFIIVYTHNHVISKEHLFTNLANIYKFSEIPSRSNK